MKIKILLFTAVLIVIIAISWGPLMSNVEQARYVVVNKFDSIEIRDYEPMIIAEVEVSGERKEAINTGFRMIADFIFGNNTSQSKVSMTAPVVQYPSEKISMTAPVIQQAFNDKWKIHFVMPAKYTIKTLPKPNNSSVKIVEIPKKRYAVIQFSGMHSPENLKNHSLQLEQFIKEKHLVSLSSLIYAFYNPPWTLPFLRRNEIMIEINK